MHYLHATKLLKEFIVKTYGRAVILLAIEMDLFEKAPHDGRGDERVIPNEFISPNKLK
jgi:hypothetical protein